jgi:hypothetical protein
MRGRLTPVVPGSHARRRAGSLLLVGASAAALVAAQAAAAVAAPATTSAVSQAQLPLSAAQAAQLSQNVTQHVIVLFKNQPRAAHEGTSAFQARASKIASFQQPLLGEFRQVHAARVQPYTLVNAVAATVSAGEEARLKANPAVQAVIPDGPVYGPSPVAPSAPASSASIIRTLPGACLPNGRVQLEPEALQLTGTDSAVPGAKTARSLGFTGAGVKVAWLADGIDPVNANFLRTPGKASTSVFVDYKDFSGDGTTAPGSQVTSGLWIAVPALATIAGFTAPAPFGATVSLNAAAVTREFDAWMTSPVGDFWLASVNPAAGVALFRINPGQTGTIRLTIKVPATATAGSVVSGDVFVDTIVPFVQDAGSETAAIPYAYTVS